MLDVPSCAREKIVEAQHVVAAGDQPIAKMASEKAGTPGDENCLHGLAALLC